MTAAAADKIVSLKSMAEGLHSTINLIVKTREFEYIECYDPASKEITFHALGGVVNDAKSAKRQENAARNYCKHMRDTDSDYQHLIKQCLTGDAGYATIDDLEIDGVEDRNGQLLIDCTIKLSDGQTFRYQSCNEVDQLTAIYGNELGGTSDSDLKDALGDDDYLDDIASKLQKAAIEKFGTLEKLLEAARASQGAHGICISARELLRKMTTEEDLGKSAWESYKQSQGT
jgi:hypothetical protein